MFIGIESDQLLQSIVMDEENNLNLPNIGPQNNDTTIHKITEKMSIIEQEEITNENKRLKTTSTVFREHAEPVLGTNIVIHYLKITPLHFFYMG